MHTESRRGQMTSIVEGLFLFRFRKARRNSVALRQHSDASESFASKSCKCVGSPKQYKVGRLINGGP